MPRDGSALKFACLALLLVLAACARQPARCERPVGLAPEAPRPNESRRLAANIDDRGTCRIKLRLPDGLSATAWVEARDAALASAALAAQTCCARPRARNVGDWASGATTFDVAYDCPAP